MTLPNGVRYQFGSNVNFSATFCSRSHNFRSTQ
jgi:hypothetical protein